MAAANGKTIHGAKGNPDHPVTRGFLCRKMPHCEHTVHTPTAFSPLRYSEIRQEILNITDAVLTSTLKSLIANGMVNRCSYDQVPSRVEYSLTEKGRSAVPILRLVGRILPNSGSTPMQQYKTFYYYTWEEPKTD